MRTAIVVILAAVFGGIVGALIARAQLTPQVTSLQRENKLLEQESIGTLQELSVAAERVAWLEAELADLRQLPSRAARSRGGGYNTASSPQPAPTDAAEGMPTDADSGTPRMGQLNAFEESPPPPPGWEQPEEDQVPLATLERRRHARDILIDEMQMSDDPVEQDRLANIHNHLRDIRDMFQEMRNAPDAETQQTYSDAIRQARYNLKTLVEDQQSDLMRRELQESGIEDPAQQREIIERLRDVQQSPFYREPMFVWGAAPPDPESAPGE